MTRVEAHEDAIQEMYICYHNCDSLQNGRGFDFNTWGHLVG
jgi:hypothetical protein